MRGDFIVRYILLLVAQMLICNYFHVSPYLMLSILPAMVLCIPTRVRTAFAMLIAFATALCVDLLAEGVLGLNILALVPVALCRRSICGFIFGEELLVREEDFSTRKYGFPKVIFALVIVQFIFLAVYLYADGAVVRPPLFSLERFGVSLLAGVLVSIPVAEILTPDDRK